MNTFARANPDLLHTLPVREINIFVKKFKAFPKKTLDRKYRAATSRLTNLYADFQMEATFNGQPTFQVSSPVRSSCAYMPLPGLWSCTESSRT